MEPTSDFFIPFKLSYIVILNHNLSVYAALLRDSEVKENYIYSIWMSSTNIRVKDADQLFSQYIPASKFLRLVFQVAFDRAQGDVNVRLLVYL